MKNTCCLYEAVGAFKNGVGEDLHIFYIKEKLYVTKMGIQQKHMYFDHTRHRDRKDLEIVRTYERDHKRPPSQRMTGEKMVCV